MFEHLVSAGALLLFLDRDLTLEVIRAMAERKPDRAVCLDAIISVGDRVNRAQATQFRIWATQTAPRVCSTGEQIGHRHVWADTGGVV